ncbi:MAG: glycoside hydrolase 100 family protein [Gemmatimonadota bacterium]
MGPADPSDPAVALLRSLSGPEGIRASATEVDNYRAVFTRDAVLAGIAGLIAGDEVVTAAFVRTLEQLRSRQGRHGQIASNFRPGTPGGGEGAVSFGTLTPKIDATSWYLLGVALAIRAGEAAAADFTASVEAAVDLLDALEYNGAHLVYVPAGGNWADEYPYSGYILSDQVLRAWALSLLAIAFDREEWGRKAARIAGAVRDRYRPADGDPAGPPPASIGPPRRWDVFDLAAAALLGVSNIAPERGAEALDWVDAEFLGRGALPPAFHPPITESDPGWDELRGFHLFDFRNRPHEYHNGGIWPIWLGWLALALALRGRTETLGRLRASWADALERAPRFDFHEFLHGRTGQPGGRPRMAYSAAGSIFLGLAGDPESLSLLRP